MKSMTVQSPSEGVKLEVHHLEMWRSGKEPGLWTPGDLGANPDSTQLAQCPHLCNGENELTGGKVPDK